MNYKENEARFEKVKFEVEMLSTIDLCGLAHNLKDEIDDLKWQVVQDSDKKELLWFKKRVLKMVKKAIQSRQKTLF